METGKVYTFKLNSGEEMIAKVLEIGQTNIIITEPVSIAPSQQGMQMIPSMFTAEQRGNVTLNTSAIAFYANTDDNIKDKYIEATTGIKLPDKKIVMG
tara:strand:- start:72 stop:365 length:294 start_codon:yes stop_codon:yes gene_type:complete